MILQTVSEKPVYGELFSLTDEDKMGHIKLSRDTDIILVAPASANLIAHMAHGLANDLATTTLLASDKPVIIAPAMNSKMWQNAYLLAKIGFDTTENEPSKICQNCITFIFNIKKKKLVC